MPGEDEAAFRERLAGWRADLKPRNEAEDALIVEAARLSWMLDRADRVEAEAAAARLAGLGDHARRRAEEEAAEAETIGRQLIEGPPIVPTPAGIPAQEAAGRRFRALMHPNDPAHPARLLRRLEATAAGCRWLLDHWSKLDLALRDADTPGWRPDDRLLVVRLLGKEPVDALDDPAVRRIYLCSFALAEKDPQVFTDQADEMTKGQFRLFLDRLKSRRAGRGVPSDRASALRGLRGLVAGIIARLDQQAAMHAERAEVIATMAPVWEAIDTSPAGERRHQLHRRIANRFHRAVDRLRKVQRLPEPADRRPIAAASEGEAEICEKIRNEPNGSPVGQAVLPDSGPIRPDPSQAGLPDLLGPIRPDLSRAGLPDGHGSDRPSTGDTTPVRIADCEKIRNEPNADESTLERPVFVSASSPLDQPNGPPAPQSSPPGKSAHPDPDPSPGSH